jgi:CPA2 family monovalent cation:H+ antiporter-2
MQAHLPPLIQDLALILALAASVAYIFHRLKQPAVIGYIVAGAVVGPNSPWPTPIFDFPNIKIWAELGVILLMFRLGLDFSLQHFRRLGPLSIMVGIGETAIMFGLGLAFASLFNFGRIETLFMGAMIAISSTTIIVKTFEEQKLTTRRFAESVLGILIIEDLIAVLALVVLNSISTGKSFEGMQIFSLVGELFIVIAGWFLIGGFIVPRFIDQIGRSTNSNELLTLLTLGLSLTLAVAASHFEYSTALGAFIMGSIISETKEASRVRDLINPLKDIFAAVFFVSIGMQIDLRTMILHPGTILLLSLLVIIGKFIALFLFLTLTGQPFRHSVRVALSMGQIGEFSFIIAGLGLASGVLRKELQPIIVSVSLITTFTTPYLIRSSDRISHLAFDCLPKSIRSTVESYSALVASRIGFGLLPTWLKPGLGRLLTNGLIVAIIFSVTHKTLEPWLTSYLPTHSFIVPKIAMLIAFVTASPFIFAMLIKAHRAKFVDNSSLSTRQLANYLREKNARAFLFVTITILWIGILITQFTSAFFATAVTFIFVAILFTVFRRRLAFSYNWLEVHFLSGLNHHETESPTQKAMNQLAPWDAHLVKLNINSNSHIVGRSIVEAKIRQFHGINVIALQRGQKVIMMPEGTTPLFPNDELLVLGTDEQIDTIRPLLEKTDLDSSSNSPNLADYDMHLLRISESSKLCGLSLKDSRIRENYGGLVVGIEHAGVRNINPPPEFIIKKGDLLWIVADRTRIIPLMS